MKLEVKMALNIIVADDHAIVSGGIRAVLSAEIGYIVVAEVKTSAELLYALELHECDLLITDYSMPFDGGMDGLALLGAIARRWPSLPVIVVTQIASANTFNAILSRSLAKGIVHKSDAMRELTAAVARVEAGGRYTSTHVGTVMNNYARPRDASWSALSTREAEVLRLFAAGKTVSEIAALSHRSVKTVSRQKVDGMRKLGLNNDLQFYAFARENGVENA